MATKLAIPISRYCTHSFSSDEQYGAWGEDFSVDVGEFAVIEPKERFLPEHQLEAYEGEVADGDQLWVIVAIWSSGDSFGYSSSGSDDVISINKDVEVAKRNLAALERNPDKNDYDSWSVTIELDDGTTHKYHRPWLGYFESLDSLQIYEMIATTEKNDE